MENEQAGGTVSAGGVLSLTPEQISAMPPDEARKAKDNYMQTIAPNPKCAYRDVNNPLHKEEVEKVNQLFARANPEPDLQTNASGLVEQYSPEVIAAMKEGLDIQAGKNQATRERVLSEAKAERKALVEKFGYQDEHNFSDEQITEHHGRAWKEQRLLTEAVEQSNADSWRQFGSMIKADMMSLGHSAEEVGLLDSFLNQNPAGLIEPVRNLLTDLTDYVLKTRKGV
jgi:hypothetical protein